MSLGYYRIGPVPVSLASCDEGLTRFADTVLAAHAMDQPVGVALRVRLDSVGLGRRPGRPDPGPAGVRVDHRLVRTDAGCVYASGRLMVEAVRRNSGVLDVRGRFVERPDRAVRRLWNPDIRPNQYMVIVRELVLAPAFWVARARHGLVPLHAAVVTDGERTLVLAGLSGVGKSTLAAWMAGEPGWSLVSENYALVGAEAVYGVREPLRVSEETVRLIGSERLARVAKPSAERLAGRALHRLTAAAVKAPAPTHVLLQSLGARWSLQPISRDEATAALLARSTYVGEVLTTPALDVGLGPPDGRTPYDARQLREALTDAATYAFTVSRREPLSETFARLNNAVRLP